EARQQAAVSDLDKSLIEEWEKQGGVQYHLGLAQRTVRAMMDGMDEGERAGFMASFDQLPAGAQTGIYRYLAVNGGAWGQASEADVETFASTPDIGADLVRAWGSAAPRKVAVVRGRMRLMLEGMSKSDRDAAAAWFEGLPDGQASAVLQAL